MLHVQHTSKQVHSDKNNLNVFWRQKNKQLDYQLMMPLNNENNTASINLASTTVSISLPIGKALHTYSSHSLNSAVMEVVQTVQHDGQLHLVVVH